MNETIFTEVRCPRCDKLLFKVCGIAIIQIECKRCKHLILWPDLSTAISLPTPMPNKEIDIKVIKSR